MKKKLRTAILVAITAAAQTATVQAQNPNYQPGDLVLYFQQSGGTKTLYVRLGDTALDFRGAASGAGAPDKINFLNINTALENAFGLDWETDTTLHAGLAGNWGSDNTDNETLQNGDPQRTIYISDQRDSVGSVGVASSTGYTLFTAGNTAMTTCAQRIFSQNNVLEVSSVQAVAEFPVLTSQIDNQNPFSGSIQGTAFNTFSGGVQQVGSASTFGTLGAAGSVEFALDLYRIVATTTAPGQVSGPLRVGTFEGTVTVSTTGQVSFISQGAPTTPYETWIGTFNPPLTNASDRLSSADPDKDGATNLEEFSFGGNPTSGSDQGTYLTQTVDANSDSQGDITLTIEVRTGATFSASGNDLISPVIDQLTYRIEGSTDLATWNSLVSEVTPHLGSGSPSTGYQFKTFRLNGGNGLVGKGFLRASAVK